MTKKPNKKLNRGIIEGWYKQIPAVVDEIVKCANSYDEYATMNNTLTPYEILEEFIVKKVLPEIKIERKWAMPNKETFKIKPIRELLMEEFGGKLSPENRWLDPFAGNNSPARYTNDLNPNTNAHCHIDALEFLKKFDDEIVEGVLFDPPYSITQAKQCYEGYGIDKLKISPTSMRYWAECKNEIARIVEPGGKVICFGWNSMGLGKKRGFVMKRILLVTHGGSKNDTIVTVEVKQ